MNQKLMKAGVLQEKHTIPDSIYDGKFNKTSQFLTPSIGVNVTHKLVYRYFENAFLTDVKHEHNYERPVFMLFSITDYNDPNWKKVYNTLIKSPNYITEYDVGIKDGKFLLMLVFQVPIQYQEDYYNFRNGRYSLFSEEYRKKFPEFLDTKKSKRNIHWEIINKSPRLKKQIETAFELPEDHLENVEEIWDLPRKKREFYRYKSDENE